MGGLSGGEAVIDDLRSMIEELIEQTEDVPDASVYFSVTNLREEMGPDRFVSKFNREYCTGRIQALGAHASARAALVAFEKGERDKAQRTLIRAQRSWIRALSYNLDPVKRLRLAILPNPPGRPAKHEDAELFLEASRLMNIDRSLKQVQACKAVLSADVRLRLAYSGRSDSGLRRAFARGKKKSGAT